MSAPGASSGDEIPGQITSNGVKASRIIALLGDLDINTSPALRTQLDGLIAGGVVVIVLDCAGLDFIDSTGLGTLVSALKQASNLGGALALARPNVRVSRFLRVTGLNTLFPIYDRLEAACAALGVPVAA